MSVQEAALPIPDVQGGYDARGVAIDEVGVGGLSYPVEVVGRDGDAQRTVAEATMTVALAAEKRGVHMSRLVGTLQRSPQLAWSA
jgi:GTP cyclohydrolase IB